MFANVISLSASTSAPETTAAAEEVMELGERVSYALNLLIQGMIIVFAVLAILWLVLAIFRFLFSRSEEKAEKRETGDAELPADAQIPAAAAPDDEVLAVITAAVAAALEAEDNPAYSGGFRVVSFRRISGASRNSRH